MTSCAHHHPEIGLAELHEVADRVFAYIQPDGSWYINNTGFIVGDRSVISIDACSTERRTRAYLDRIATVTPAPVTTLINTHHHGDHTYGNSVFGDVTIIGQERCREEVIATGLLGNTGIWEPVDWGELRLAPPDGRLRRPTSGLVGMNDQSRSATSASRRIPVTTASSGCRSRRCCSAATCCSTAVRRSS